MNTTNNWKQVYTKPAPNRQDWFNQIMPTSIGFDSMFEHVESILKNSVSSTSTNYPPYNLIKVDDNVYHIEMALAGFAKEDIAITVDKDKLTIKSESPTSTDKEEQPNYIHKGISQRSFSRSFNLAEMVQVQEATMKDGLLTVTLERIIPEDMQPKTIEIV